MISNDPAALALLVFFNCQLACGASVPNTVPALVLRSHAFAPLLMTVNGSFSG
jgi:hypothetical protein